jgi:hypothetical protein
VEFSDVDYDPELFEIISDDKDPLVGKNLI